MDQDRIIRLDQVLKLVGWVDSGGVAKHLIQEGRVCLNGAVETHRSKKVRLGDVVSFEGRSVTVTADLLG